MQLKASCFLLKKNKTSFTPGKILRLFVLAFLIFLPCSRMKAQSLYVTDSNGNIFLVNMANCTSTLIYPSNGTSWLDIAVCSGNPNIIYALDFSNNVYQIDVTTGVLTLINSSFNTFFSTGGASSLVCDGNGNLYAANTNLYSYNIATNTWTDLGYLNGYISGGDLTFYNGQLYMAGSGNELVQISLNPLSASFVATFNAPNSVFGVVTIGGSSLCGNQVPTSMLAMAGADIFSVNPANGNCTAACIGLIPLGIFGAASLSEGVNPPPSIVTIATSDTSICTGETTTLSASGAGSGGIYAWQPGNLSGSSISVSPTVNTIYSVIGTDTSGCSDTAYVTITVNPPVQLSGTSQDVNCFGACNGTAGVTIVNGNGPYTYAWSPSGGTNANASSLCAGAYSCLVTGAGGCNDTQTFTITQPNAITALVNQVNDSCFGECIGSVNLSVSGGSGQNYTYLWSPGGGTSSSESALCAGNYSCTITDSLGCSITPVVIITQPTLLTVTNPNPLSICVGTTVMLSSTVAGGTGPYSYSWQPGNLSGASPSVTPATSTVYSLTVTDTNNCTVNSTQSITVNPDPVPAFIASDSTGCAPLCVTFTSPTQAGDICQWNFGDGNTMTGNSPQNHCYTIPGIYSVSMTLTDNNGCTGITIQNNLINVFASPFATFSFSPDYITIFDPHVSFTDESNGVDTWSWDFGDPLHSNSILENPQFIYQDTGCYAVTLSVSNLNGCMDDTTEDVCILSDYVFYAPNTFTPNGNGLNDFFSPVINGYKEGTYHLMIFDRWGNLIFETRDLSLGWDGKVQNGKSGNICQEDTYVWVVNVNEWNGTAHTYRGHVNLIR